MFHQHLQYTEKKCQPNETVKEVLKPDKRFLLMQK